MDSASTAVEPIYQDGRGRPTLCTPEKVHKIVSAIAVGSYWEPACEAAGVSYQAVRNWIARAKGERDAGLSASDSVYLDFLEQLERAQAEAETALVRAVAGTPDDWRAQAFILERRHRERWGKSETAVQVTNVVISDQLIQQLTDSMRVAGVAIETSALPVDPAEKP